VADRPVGGGGTVVTPPVDPPVDPPVNPPSATEEVYFPDQGQASSYFTASASTFTDTPLTYDGVTYTKAVKIDSKGYITFTTTGPAAVIFYAAARKDVTGRAIQIAQGTYTSSTELRSFPLSGMTRCEYSVSGAGTYTIKQKTGETGVYYVAVKY
jgi:hypothetical protein